MIYMISVKTNKIYINTIKSLLTDFGIKPGLPIMACQYAIINIKKNGWYSTSMTPIETNKIE